MMQQGKQAKTGKEDDHALRGFEERHRFHNSARSIGRKHGPIYSRSAG
jgi:hypothetical protein